MSLYDEIERRKNILAQPKTVWLDDDSTRVVLTRESARKAGIAAPSWSYDFQVRDENGVELPDCTLQIRYQDGGDSIWVVQLLADGENLGKLDIERNDSLAPAKAVSKHKFNRRQKGKIDALVPHWRLYDEDTNALGWEHNTDITVFPKNMPLEQAASVFAESYLNIQMPTGVQYFRRVTIVDKENKSTEKEERIDTKQLF